MPKTSLVIITWNDKDNLENCLDSIMANIDNFLLEIIVVDNGSTDGTKSMLKKFKNNPKLKIIENTENLGITKARNLGWKQSRGEQVFFCDSDIIIKKQDYKLFFDFFDINQKAGIVGCKLLYANEAIQYSCRKFPTFKTFLLRAIGKNNSPAVQDSLMVNWDHNSVQKVDWVMGACMLIKRNVLNTIKGFDERYFYVYDDVDFCFRAKKAGFETWYTPDNSMTHIYQRKSASRKFSKKFLKHHLINAIRFLLSSRNF